MTRSIAANTVRMAVLAAAVVACTGGRESPKVSLAQASADSARPVAGVESEVADVLPPESQAALDSGNTFFRNRAYAAALKQYRRVSVLSPRSAAAFYGIYMVAQATHDTKLADSAVAGIRASNAAPPSPGFDQPDTGTRAVRPGAKKGSNE